LYTLSNASLIYEATKLNVHLAQNRRTGKPILID